ncbi:MAG: hypothetical protein COA94_07040 [Rickettsiales bacterium]|nr:MAG: hypothetical protein COA94_07040 [Rickettsiales bacterium]
MFFKSLSSLFVDSISLNKSCKYKVLSIDEGQIPPEVICEIIADGTEIKFKLEDIIKENKLKYFMSKDALQIANCFQKIKSNSNAIRERNNQDNKYLHTLSQMFTVLFIVSNIAAAKLSSFQGIAFCGGIITFPMLYVLNDVITEVYGFRASRRVIWTALFYNLLAFSLLYLAIFLPHHDSWSNHEAFEKVFSLSPRIFVASMTSYLVGEFFNSVLLANLKIKFNGRFFGLRALFSTLSASFVDTAIFFFILFWGVIPYTEMIPMVVILGLVKVLYEALLIPLTIRLVAFLKLKENSDVFEKPSLSNMMLFTG